MVGISAGLDLSNIDATTPEEIDAYLVSRWVGRGPLYDMYATSLMADYAPDFLKLHRWSADGLRPLPSQVGGPNEAEAFSADSNPNILPATIPQLYSYMMLGWETGIRNEFRVLRRLGLTKAQIMEIVLFGRLCTGMRGLGHVYQAIGDVLPDYADPPVPALFPTGWEPDAAAFKCGLDLSTRELTEQDRINLIAWYETTIGELPRSIAFGMRYDPQFLKAHRALWEVCFKTLPKQVAPYLMLRDATMASDRDALREATLLGKAWGLTPDWIIRGITYTAHYFTGLRGLYAAHDAVDDILREWR
jgi:hypothetical protein